MKHLDKNKALKPNSESDDTTRHTRDGQHGGRSGRGYEPGPGAPEAGPTSFTEVGSGEPQTEE